MDQHYALPPGSSLWWISLIAIVLVGFGILAVARKADVASREKMRKALFIFFTINFLSFHAYAIATGGWKATTALPFHLCSISYIMGLIALKTLKQFPFEFSAFLGIAGGINSLLTPEFAYGYDAFLHVQYYLEHGGIVIIPLFLGIAYNMKPRRLSWLSIMIPLNMLAIIMYALNAWLGSNYMYVNVKPIADNPFLIGDWPYYIFVLEFVVLIHSYLIYICFHRFKKFI